MPDSPKTPTTEKPLRILIGADTFAPEINGAATFAARLAAGLVERGHDVHIVAPAASRKHGTWTETLEGQPMTVHRLKSWRWYPHPWLRFALPWQIEKNSARVLDEVKPDVVHFQSHIIVGRGLSNQAVKRGIRIVGTNHFMPENMLEHTLLPKFVQGRAVKLAWEAAARSFARAEVVTTPTRKAADFLEHYTKVRGVLAISCGVDAQHYTPDFTPRTENLIVFVGRITHEKQLDKLIRAFAQLDPALDAKLELVGGGEQENNLKSLASQLGVRDRVTFTGYAEEDYLRHALTRATVFAMPSIAELQSIATMEAMASGLPVVAANAMALPHLVHHGENGFLFEPGNVEEFAARLTDILSMPEDELQRFKQESLRIVAAHDIQRTVSTFEAIYRGEPIPDVVIDTPTVTPAP
ncbi:glycosyltransferase involved in cell wall biosynthesis [Conyzicola lurida]|uniref:D-inositol 3-phosphate glycosyltransferase n=1 Tax=Conyzicola lurida TaxID=1172621 RepID=A0A841AP83_9MICO|nr:glycosyltransferase [Conyzicola lurida]MBB5843365.1 glycosyltransferase involved in cell wall biosynthesis [Conyzicola lurida]